MEVICTNSARIALTKELDNNNVPYDFGSSISRIVVQESPKVKMALRMVRERLGQRAFIIN